MNDIAQQHRQALEATRTTVAGVKADQWAAPTPNEGCDLAVATSQDTTLDPDLVEACLAVVEPQAGQFQASGAFGAHVDVPAGADTQTRLLGLLGRRPPHR